MSKKSKKNAIISHNFQEVVQDSEIFCAMSADHSALFCSFQHFNKLKKDSGLWKFNNSLVSNEDFIQKCTEHIQKVKGQLNLQTHFCYQTKWEILKYEIRLFTISFSKNRAQLRAKKQSAFENRLKILESNLNSNRMLEKCNKCKNKFGEIYDNIAEGVKVRSKITWYEEGEKYQKIF